MCRLLLVENPSGIDPNPILEQFRAVCKNSREYQGHGWGSAWLDEHGQWRFHHSIDPIWEDPMDDFPHTRLFLVHARSAFRDEGIVVENNMPFTDGASVFLYNGELRGVRIKAEGRIGAEKIYNFIRRFDMGDLSEAVKKGVGIIDRRTLDLMLKHDFIPTLGSAYPLDLRLPEYFASQQFLIAARPGAILVLHDGAKRTRTLRILERVLPHLTHEGYSFVTLTELTTVASSGS